MPWPVPRSLPAGSEGGMTKTYRDWSTDQSYLFPPSPHDWLPEADLVYFLLDTVATLDLSPIFAHPRPPPPLRPLPARAARSAAVPSPDDGRSAAVLLRHRDAVLAEDHEAV